MRNTILLLVGLSIVVLITTSSVSNVNDLCDSPLVGGHSGAPGSPGCEFCHGGTPNTGSGNVSFDFGNGITQYVPGDIYDATVTVSQADLDKYGFVITARKSTNASVGDFVLIDSINTRKFTESGKKYFGHTPCGADALVPGSRTWNFQWTAPATDEGVVTFYISSLAANHDHDLTGDQVYALTKTLDISTGTLSSTMIEDVRVFSNPEQDEAIILLSNDWINANLTLISADGRNIHIISSSIPSNRTSIRKNDWNLSEGIYLIKIQLAEQMVVKKIILL
ncbi:MAG: choice-of-anchor V domain-containing protein [Chitinophagales bacterium]